MTDKAQEQPSSCPHMFCFWFQILAQACCATFFLDHTVGSPSPVWEGSEEFPELLFQMGLLYLWPRGTTVSEEILYNVIVGEGHLRLGSLLHVSSLKWYHLSFRKLFTQNSSIVWRDYFLKNSQGTFKIISLKTHESSTCGEKFQQTERLNRVLFG